MTEGEMGLPFALPVPVALAAPTTQLHPVGMRAPRWSAKFDGYRALATSTGRVYSRRGTDLSRAFPEVASATARQLPAGTVVDGELVVWDQTAGRTDFDALGRRLMAGRQTAELAAEAPAQLVVFDVLADRGRDVRGERLDDRRRRLEQMLADATAPLVLIEQTDDPAVAGEWFDTLHVAGVEGLVVKDAAGTYPTRVTGQRVWAKHKIRHTVDLVAVGYTGHHDNPGALLLADPANPDVPVGSTGRLDQAAVAALAGHLHPTGATIVRRFAFSVQPTDVHLTEPLPVEVLADVARTASCGIRHSARLLRVRHDLR